MTSCSEPSSILTSTTYEPLPLGQFWAVNPTTEKYYKVRATKKYEGIKCDVWAEDGSGVDEATAKRIADEYEGVIENLILGHFGIENFNFTFSNGGTASFSNVMDFANYITNSEKFIILLLDIKDGYKKDVNDAYVGGYFSPVNYFQTSNSNLKNMIYLDTNPGLEEEKEKMYETLAHEFQHLTSFIAALVKRSKQEKGVITSIGQLDTGIDEGLSTMAEYFFQNQQTDRYRWFISKNAEDVGTLAKGNNFYVWNNHKENPLSILDEYATAYMFFHWLYLQSNNNPNLFKNISGSAYGDYRALTGVAMQIDSGWSNWKTLLGDWLAANYENASSGKHGYKGDSKFSGVTVSTPPTTTPHTLKLYPGEGVYSKSTGSVPASSGNINYVELTKGANKALLSFNANTSISGNTETAQLTGTALSVSAAPARSLLPATPVPARPWVIDISVAIDWQEGLPLIEQE